MQSGKLADQDRVVYGARWVLLLFLCGALLAFRNQVGTFSVDSLTTVFMVGVVANLITLPMLTVPPLRGVASAIIFCADLLFAIMFTAISQGNLFVIVLSGGSIMVSGLTRADLRWNLAQVIGVFTAVISTMLLAPETMSQMALVALVVIGVVVIAVSYAYETELGVLRRRVRDLAASQVEHVEDIRQRTRAISELTYTMSATLNYKKVLDTVLEAGRLGLRMPEHEQASLFAGIFLYHVDDNHLHVVSSRRFTRADEARVLIGTEGIVGRALREAVPVFGTDAANDPDLQNFVAFHGCRSVLCIPLRAGFDNFGVLVYGSDTPNAFTQEHSELLSALGVQATLALQNAVLYHNLIEEKERIVDVDEEARKKLARDLHDGPTQSVAAIAMRMSYIQKLYKKSPEQVPDEIKKVEELARRTTTEIRHMLFTLRPLVLETQGMSAALNQLAEKMHEMHGQAVAVRVERGVENRLDYQQQGVIFYIVEEAVNNARKHARAKLISVLVGIQNDMAVVQIADNGVGFDVEKVKENYESRASLGMVNMRERAELLDGSLNMESVKGKGTVITLLLPLKSPAEVISANGFSRPRTKLALAAAARIERAENRQPYL